jgi:hypothetical protein
VKRASVRQGKSERGARVQGQAWRLGAWRLEEAGGVTGASKASSL